MRTKSQTAPVWDFSDREVEGKSVLRYVNGGVEVVKEGTLTAEELAEFINLNVPGYKMLLPQGR